MTVQLLNMGRQVRVAVNVAVYISKYSSSLVPDNV